MADPMRVTEIHRKSQPALNSSHGARMEDHERYLEYRKRGQPLKDPEFPELN